MGILGLLALLTMGIYLWNRHKTTKIMEHLNQKLYKAMDSSFTEEDFDETLLSFVETKLAHYFV